MGIEIDRERFDDADYTRFTRRLEHCLQALGQLLARPGFGVGPRTIGAELELFLIDDQGRPLAKNQAILEDTGDPHLTLELDRFNLEVNPSPLFLEGQPLSGLGRELEGALESVRATARGHGGRVAMVGILPTLRDEDLHRGAITDAPRYRALDWSLRQVRTEPFEIEIAGRDPEPLRVVRDNIVMEGANTSFQVHLRVDPGDYVDTFNAAQLATAPVLAAAGNSPLFLGRVLWEETRIALFEQAADDRDTPGRERLVSRVAFGTDWLRSSVLDLFEESVRHHEPLLPICGDQDPLLALEADGVPRLDELRLHQGTVWRWNRAIYDSGFGGHLRIELRPLPAGPTVVDMLANAAFLLGLTLALAPDADRWTRELLFGRAHANFYEAARVGLEAELEWPTGSGGGPERVGAAELVRRLLPEARRGLVEAGVDEQEAGRLLEVIEGRVASGQTGAVWQRRALAALEARGSGGLKPSPPETRAGREQALPQLLERYLELQAGGDPVHTWPVDS
ncbi:MAG TPA: glutamate--cysteine ligase [Actinomycetes bacterium]|nr:glutamate--cysteine ligase [Actinomycetes bacterium]